jgi:hypothetical protein
MMNRTVTVVTYLNIVAFRIVNILCHVHIMAF